MRLMIMFSLAALVVVAGAGAGVTTQTADVLGPMFGPGDTDPARALVASEGATLQRSENGISVKLKMPTPAPGSYTYPGANPFLPAAVQGHPEAFSLWVFYFNNPAGCSAPCDSNDIGATPAMGGVINGAGHISGGGTLNFAGHVSTNSTPFGGSMLISPMTAEVHLAVAPHGAVVPELMPDQITKPIGNPTLWWVAIFPTP